ncbi:MAG TPA: sugar ABC transporter ATP-binding protein [Hypericibacter adhaerens]|jgi:ribose transport system ATP-binding protein|uniref:ABC transporter n=1 Tax=Hypericibacter adhaerens TaxID=2602016 RepID=A0A5J6N3P0_9PROT|nr:sugar ABC transporter ATP-binding protein [Hypericibacter adhaerens]QEX24652.1 ABC transporter [Hypericibacter adhaerens]HWA45862.1 sugar ABC transporter ATP-binding protein [Hypericibacter adhaerens]
MHSIEPVAAIKIDAVRKAFGATVALDNVNVVIEPGTVHALLGENGAGKSTLVKMMSGLIRPDAGRILVDGQEVNLSAPSRAHQHGIQTAFQELTLVPDLTVAQNMLLPYQPTGFAGLIRERHGAGLVAEHMARVGLGDIDILREVRQFDLATRQKIEIARAIMRKPRVLLLDEPTSSLSGPDIDWLGKLIADLQAVGTTMVFISHRLPEVRRFCNRLTVLRNGRDIGTFAPAELKDEQVVEMIVGRSLSTAFPAKPPLKPRAKPVLAARNLATDGGLADATLDLYPGEIVGVAGLQGMGQQELFRALFGAAALNRGHIEVEGHRVALTSPRDAIDPRVGISLVPEERKTEGLFLRLDGRRNVSIPVIQRFAHLGMIKDRAETVAAATMLDRVQVAPRALYSRLSRFSGGNQQKVAIAKWLMTSSRTLLMLDPTRGVDVGTKHEIYLIMRDFAIAGGAILFFSTEVEELVNLSHRVLVMYKGRIVTHLDGAKGQISESSIMHAALGHAEVQETPSVAVGGAGGRP